MTFDGKFGIVWNKAKFGEYFDHNGNVIRRENCGENPDQGKI